MSEWFPDGQIFPVMTTAQVAVIILTYEVLAWFFYHAYRLLWKLLSHE